jgi:tRNA G18 (ribose-2'-O)-methylase SpoU
MKAGILVGHLKNKGNAGAIIRTAEAFGINLVFVIGEPEERYNTAEGTDKHMTYLKFKTIDEFINYAIKNNHHIVCIENVNDAVEINSIEKYPVNPIFVSGHEKDGVPKELLDNASLIIKIQQGMGYANCLNTGTACGIIIHDFFKTEILKKNKLWGIK